MPTRHWATRSCRRRSATSGTGSSTSGTAAAARLPEFEALRDSARDIKNHALAHLDLYLERYERKVTEAGGRCTSPAPPTRRAPPSWRSASAAARSTITKGKSMIAEEIGLNAALETAGMQPVETDLGEYIIQLRDETPSHIIAPAVHVNATQVEADFRRVHTALDPDRDLSQPVQLLTEARAILREKFLIADVGITGANFLVAETGTSIIVTNEGNGDLTQTLPKVHIVVTSIEKVVPTLDDVAQLAAGAGEVRYGSGHVGLHDAVDRPAPAGRSRWPGRVPRRPSRQRPLVAARQRVPGHAALHPLRRLHEPLPGLPCGRRPRLRLGLSGSDRGRDDARLIGVEKAGHLPNASTFCGRCESVCPVRIPLPKLMRHWREREFERHLSPATVRSGLAFWAFFAKRPSLYRFTTGIAMRVLALMGRRKGRFRSLPLMGNWTDYRDFAVPQGETFQARWARQRGKADR